MAVKARDEITLARVDDGADGAAGADGQMLYATCETVSATVAKVATLAAGTLTLKAGATVAVRFTNANNAASPTLNISGTGAKAIYTQGVRYAYWAAGATVIFTYDGTYWRVASEPVYASTVTVGNPAGKHVFIDDDGIDIRNGDTALASFEGGVVRFLSGIMSVGVIQAAGQEYNQSYVYSRDLRITAKAPGESGYEGAPHIIIDMSGVDINGITDTTLKLLNSGTGDAGSALKFRETTGNLIYGCWSPGLYPYPGYYTSNGAPNDWPGTMFTLPSSDANGGYVKFAFSYNCKIYGLRQNSDGTVTQNWAVV